MKFIRRLNRENFYFFKLEFSNFVAKEGHGSYETIQNFSSISLKLHLLCQKNTGTWGVNTTIINMPFGQYQGNAKVNMV